MAEPPTVVATELGVAPAVGASLLVLQMQELQRDVLATSRRPLAIRTCSSGTPEKHTRRKDQSPTGDHLQHGTLSGIAK